MRKKSTCLVQMGFVFISVCFRLTPWTQNPQIQMAKCISLQQSQEGLVKGLREWEKSGMRMEVISSFGNNGQGANRKLRDACLV